MLEVLEALETLEVLAPRRRRGLLSAPLIRFAHVPMLQRPWVGEAVLPTATAPGVSSI